VAKNRTRNEDLQVDTHEVGHQRESPEARDDGWYLRFRHSDMFRRVIFISNSNLSFSFAHCFICIVYRHFSRTVMASSTKISAWLRVCGNKKPSFLDEFIVTGDDLRAPEVAAKIYTCDALCTDAGPLMYQCFRCGFFAFAMVKSGGKWSDNSKIYMDHVTACDQAYDEEYVIKMAARVGDRPPAIAHSLLSGEILEKVYAREEEEKKVSSSNSPNTLF